MPIPQKQNNETDEQFIERCVADEFMQEYDDNDQRLAVCYAQLEEDRALEDINTKPTQEMAAEAEQGLEWREEFGRGGTEIGVARARDLKNRVNLSIETIKRMFSYFSRHEVDKEAEGFRKGEDGYPSAGRIAWALWGGDPGFAWTKRKIEEIEKEERELTGKVKTALQKKVKDHNEEIKELDLDWNARVTLNMLEKVFDRGVGAYKTNPGSVRPSVSSPEQWAMARVNSFLFALKKGRFQGGKHDTDLLPNNHPVKKEMEEKYIDMKNKEIRTINVQDLELRMDGDKPTVIGYGAVFNSMSNDLGGFREYIGKEAFEGRLEDDVRFLINHDGLPLARTTNGTLRLSVDEKGLKYEAKMPNTTQAKDLMELLKDGTVSQSSFAFIVEDDSWEMKDGMNIRTINKISRLFDVSAVTYPAYNEASSNVALRSLEQWKEQEETKKLEENLEKEKIEAQKEEQDLNTRSLAKMRVQVLKHKL